MVTQRLADKIYRVFGKDANTISSMLQEAKLDAYLDEEEVERIQVAAIIVARGDVDKFLEAIMLMELDWRDLLFEAGLEEDDYPSRLENFFSKGEASP